jgi:hypothetical protein
MNNIIVRIALAGVCSLMFACAIHKPLEYETDAVAAVCGASNGELVVVSHMGDTKLVHINLVPSWDQLETYCGVTGGACVYKGKAVSSIYMMQHGNCLHLASHELAHVFDVGNIDIQRGRRRR